MREEEVTKALLTRLKEKGWTIVSYDFPQSGTGDLIRPNNSNSKNKESFIPDIVAYKEGTVLFFENKDRFVYSDFVKVDFLRKTDIYSEDITELLKGIEYSRILYGVGMPYSVNAMRKTKTNLQMVDFAVLVDNGNFIQIQEPLLDF